MPVLEHLVFELGRITDEGKGVLRADGFRAYADAERDRRRRTRPARALRRRVLAAEGRTGGVSPRLFRRLRQGRLSGDCDSRRIRRSGTGNYGGGADDARGGAGRGDERGERPSHVDLRSYAGDSARQRRDEAARASGRGSGCGSHRLCRNRTRRRQRHHPYHHHGTARGRRLCDQRAQGLHHQSQGGAQAALAHAHNADRILTAAEAVGIGRAALERALRYARERIVFGRPIGSYQAIAHPLADAFSQLEVAELMVLKAASLFDRRLPCGVEANIAKLRAAEAAFYACDRAVQTLGGYGYMREYDVERFFRECRMLRIAPITQEMALNSLAEHALRLPRSY